MKLNHKFKRLIAREAKSQVSKIDCKGSQITSLKDSAIIFVVVKDSFIFFSFLTVHLCPCSQKLSLCEWKWGGIFHFSMLHCSNRPLSSVHVQFRSVQDGIYVLGKAHMPSTPSVRSFPNVAFEMVPRFIWLTMALLFMFQVKFLAEGQDDLYQRRIQHRWGTDQVEEMESIKG